MLGIETSNIHEIKNLNIKFMKKEELKSVVSEEVVTAIKEENKISEINLQKVLLEEFYGELNYSRRI